MVTQHVTMTPVILYEVVPRIRCSEVPALRTPAPVRRGRARQEESTELLEGLALSTDQLPLHPVPAAASGRLDVDPVLQAGRVQLTLNGEPNHTDSG